MIFRLNLIFSLMKTYDNKQCDLGRFGIQQKVILFISKNLKILKELMKIKMTKEKKVL